MEFKKHNTWEAYRRLIVFIKLYIKVLCLAIICMIIAALAYVAVPWILQRIVDDVLIHKQLMQLNIIAGVILLIFLVRAFAVYGQTYMMSYVGQRVVIDIRERVYRHLQKLGVDYYDRRKAGSIMSNLTNDVNALQAVIVDNLVQSVTETITLIGSIVSMVLIDWKMTLLIMVIVPVVLGITNAFSTRLRNAGHDVQGRIADITALLQETITGIRVVRSFAREEYEIQRFQTENDRNFKAVMKATKLTSMLTPMIEFAASISVTIIIWYGGYSVISGAMTSGELIAFLTYAINLTNPVKRLSTVYGNIQKSLAAAERIFAILDTRPSLQEKKEALTLPYVEGRVVFQNVSFSYDGIKPALQHLYLSIHPGETVAIVGPSGAGKSTIANLLPRFYEVTDGSISIDGVDIRDVTLTSLREQIGLVPQDTILFNASVKDNILYGRLDATDEEVYAAARAANALDFIEKLPQGMDTIVGDRGSSLSGGQRQRISIARAILKNPRVLILDEATSALDTESEKVVQEALDRLMQGRTAFVIAHRLSTIRNADRICVLQEGVLVEEGTHEELLAKEGLYAYLYSVQFKQHDE